MKNIDNILLIHDADNHHIIINLDDICYIKDYTCITCNSDIDISIIHNVEKVQELIKQNGCPSNWLYLHDTNNNPVLVNIENIQHIISDEIIFVNNDTLSVNETVTNIYKKLQAYKNSKQVNYDAAISSKVKTDNLGKFKTGSNNGIIEEEIPVIIKLY